MTIAKNNLFGRKILFFIIFIISVFSQSLFADVAMVNVASRHCLCLNGNWDALADQSGSGDWKQVWLEKTPEKETDFVEYSFDGAPVLKVPADFNSQLCELAYYEGVVWYRKQFTYYLNPQKRLFIHFGSINYTADIYLNGEKIGHHEGGFTPFQFEVTEKVKNGKNSLIVKVDNKRLNNGLPGLGYDWFNYGGITGDVNLIETPGTYINDYHIQLKKGSTDHVSGWVQVSGTNNAQPVTVTIPELNIICKAKTDSKGKAAIGFKAPVTLWSPTAPKQYKVIVATATDTVIDEIGFRCVEVVGNQLMLNKKPIFLNAVNIHAENPFAKSRASTKEDALILLNAAKELGCNLVRLAHYPHSEIMVKEAERMGLMVWEELPVYQHIDFADPLMTAKLDEMLAEMITRDRNRCAVVIWSLSNETYSGKPGRDAALINLTGKCRAFDSIRLVTHVINTQRYENNTFTVWDTLYRYSDLIAINEYIGWYIPWQGKPTDVRWNLVCPDKPVFISEFGGEALYQSKGPVNQASSWTEEYQEQIYIDQLSMFNTVPNLCGICPWLLFDYRSLSRMHPVYQKGHNRKGLLSENGEKKKAWFIVNSFYNQQNKRN